MLILFMLCLLPQYLHASQIRISKILVVNTVMQQSHCFIEVKKKVGTRCKWEDKKTFLQWRSSFMDNLCFVALSINCCQSGYCFRKTTLMLSLPKHPESNCENDQTAQRISVCQVKFLEVSLQSLSSSCASHPILSLVQIKKGCPLFAYSPLPALTFILPDTFFVFIPSFSKHLLNTTRCEALSWGQSNERDRKCSMHMESPF